MIKRYLFIFISILFITFLVACQNKIIEEDKLKEDEELFIVDGTKTLDAKTLWEHKDEDHLSNLVFDETNFITLNNVGESGTYQSKALEVKNFEQLVLSWNVKDLEDARLTFFVAIGDGTNFGVFQIMGLFKDGSHMSFSASDDDFSSVSIDTLINKDPNQYNYMKLKVVILPNNASNLKLENISVTTKKVNNTLLFDETKLIDKTIDVAPMQQLSIPNIGNVICSPTSVAMVLNHYGHPFTQEEVAKKVYDTSRSIYGNWTFNASYAGTLDGIKARVEYIDDFNTVINYIENDIPVIFSVTTTTLEQLDGSIMAFPAGHLIVLKGFRKIDGTWYGVFNDPAEYEDAKVERLYRLEQVLQVWKQYTYIITTNQSF